MVKFMNRNLSPSLHCPLFPPRYCIYRHYIYLLLIQQLSCNYEEPACVRKDFIYKYVLNGSKYVLKCWNVIRRSVFSLPLLPWSNIDAEACGCISITSKAGESLGLKDARSQNSDAGKDLTYMLAGEIFLQAPPLSLHWHGDVDQPSYYQ